MLVIHMQEFWIYKLIQLKSLLMQIFIYVYLFIYTIIYLVSVELVDNLVERPARTFKFSTALHHFFYYECFLE